MYNPKHFQVDDLAELHAMLEQFSFATLVTQHDGAPFATHLPLQLDRSRGPLGALIGHVSRANPQWQHLAAGQPALAIFQGPHAYISPSWYRSAPNVPTWNYLAAHATCAARIVDDPAEQRAMLARLVDSNEAGFEHPWRMDLPDEYMDRMLRGIVGFELAIERLEGKHKLSQNRSADDRAGVIAALASSPDPLAASVGDLMSEG